MKRAVSALPSRFPAIFQNPPDFGPVFREKRNGYMRGHHRAHWTGNQLD
jgi:hypothetical protein